MIRFIRAAMVLLIVSWFAIAGSNALAGESTAGKDRPVSHAVQEIKKDLRESGSAVKETARDIKDAVREAARDTKRATKKAFQDTREAVREQLQRP